MSGLSPCEGGGGGGGDLPQLTMPNTHIFHFQNRETHFGHCPILLSPPSNTKHSVEDDDDACKECKGSNTKIYKY